MSYTTSDDECLVQDEGSQGSEIGYLDIANWVSGLIGKDGTNPPFYKADDFENTFILNHNKLKLDNCVFKDSKKVIEMTSAYGENNDISFHISDTEFTDGDIINLSKKRAKNGCNYILNPDEWCKFKHFIHITGSKQVNFYGSTFKSYSDTTKFITTSSIDPRVYSCTFDGVGIVESQGVDIEAPTISNISEASLYNYGTGYNNAKYINCSYPIYNPKVETNETNTSFINCSHTVKTLIIENTNCVITDGTWVDTPFNVANSNSKSDLIRKFTLTVNSDIADCNYIYRTTEDGFDTMQTWQSLTIGTKEFDRIIAGDSSTTEKTNHEVRCGKPGYIRIDRILAPKQISTSSLGENIETVKNVGTLFNLTIDNKVDTAGYSSSGVSIDHTNTKITITEDINAQQLYDTMNTDSNSAGGIEYDIYYEMIWTDTIKTSYDIDIDNCIFTGNFELTGTLTLLNGGSVNGSYIDSTADSSLLFTGITTWKVYSNATDRDNNTNLLWEWTVTNNYRFNFIENTIYYLRLATWNEILFKDYEPLNEWVSVVDLTTSWLLTTLPIIIDWTIANKLDWVNLPWIIRNELEETTVLAKKTDITPLAKTSELTTVNDNVKKASLSIPATDDI